ncbi:Uncharacterized protein FWK35_00027505, partial [Aphis craccivora]
KGAANAEVLQKLILEAIILLEKAGLHVHIVVTDGGVWNRGMWKLFGIYEDNVGCTHPVHQNRNLWFASDFPHLIKTTWSRVLKQQILETPDGTVNLKYWKLLLEFDERTLTIKSFNELASPFFIGTKHKDRSGIITVFCSLLISTILIIMAI